MEETLVVIPTYNEKDNVRGIAAAVHQHAPHVHILFVDDNSPDGTCVILDELAADHPAIHVLHRRDKGGLGPAYVAGFRWALERSYDYVFEMDADFSHDPADIPRFLAAAAEADLVLGSRYIGGIRIINWPLARLILSKAAAIYVRLITGMPFSDPTGGYKCYRRNILEAVSLDHITSNGYAFQIEMCHFAWINGFHITEIPITFEERRSGVSKMNSAIVFEALLTVWKLWFRAGLRRRPPRRPNPRSIVA